MDRVREESGEQRGAGRDEGGCRKAWPRNKSVRNTQKYHGVLSGNRKNDLSQDLDFRECNQTNQPSMEVMNQLRQEMIIQQKLFQ